MTLEQNKSNLVAIGLVCLGFLAFTVSDATSKLLTGGFHPFMVLFMVTLTTMIVSLSYALFTGGVAKLKTKHPKLHFIRAILVTGIAFLNITAFQTIQLDEFYAVVFTSPLWVALLSAFVVKDELGAKRLISIIAGFVVILFMLRPTGDVFGFDALLVLISSVLFSFSILIIRMIGDAEPPLLYLVYFSTFSAIVSGVTVFAMDVVTVPDLKNAGIVVLTGGFVILGVLASSRGFQKAHSAAVVAPYHYTQMVWGIILGYFMFGDMPSRDVLIGSSLLILAGLYITYSEAKARPKSMPHNVATDVQP